MGIFDNKEERDAKKAAQEKLIKDFMGNLEKKLHEVTPEQAKQDLHVLVVSLVGFFGKENPKLFTPGKEEGWYLKNFMTTISSVAIGALAGGMEEKTKDFMNLFPVIQRYANVQ